MASASQYRIFIRSCLFLVTLLFVNGTFAQKKPTLSEEQQINFERLYLNGAREKMLLNNDEAIKQFRACTLIDPTNAAVYYNLAELYFDKKMLQDAEENVQKAIALEKENLWYRKLLGEVYEVKKDYNKAAEVAIYLSTKENEVTNLVQAAYLYSMDKNYPKAIATLDKVEKLIGINEEIIKQKEQIYLASNKLDKAIKELEKLRKAYPQNMRYVGMIADLYMANGKTDKAVQLYQQILKQDPKNGYAAFSLSDYYRDKGDKEKWFEMLRLGISSNDVDVKSKLRMLVGFMALGEFDNNQQKSQQLADAFISANPNEATAYLVKGDLYTQEQNYLEAHNQYHKATTLEPSILVAWQQMIFCSGQLLNNEMMQKDCEEAIEYFPNEVSLYFYHAIASMQLKQYEKAVEGAKKGIELSEGDNQMLIGFYSTLGDAYHYLKNDAACDSAYEKALSLDANNAYALNNYAYFLSLRKQNLDKAEAMSKKSLELEPENASYFDTYGWILYQKEEYDKAKEYIDKSLKLAPNNAEVVEHLGDILYQLNQKDKALEIWKRAKELGSDSEFIEKKIKDGKLYE